jgi:hypothetical protein
VERTPIGPTPSRADVLGQLKRGRWLAADTGETALVAWYDRQIEYLSAGGTSTAPTRETAASSPPHETTARTAKPKPNQTPKGNRRVSARRSS